MGSHNYQSDERDLFWMSVGCVLLILIFLSLALGAAFILRLFLGTFQLGVGPLQLGIGSLLI